MRQTQPSNVIRQFVIRADVDRRLNEIAKLYRIGPQSMLERMILSWDKKPEVIEPEQPMQIKHHLSEGVWQILDAGRRMNEQKAQYEQQQQQLKESKQ